MKDKFHIDHIRTLLHKYYEGETTPEEELHLETFFRNTPAHEIPEDLALDSRIFTSLASFHPGASEMEIRDDLFEKISEISFTNHAQNSEKAHRNRATRAGYFLAAACACLLLAIGARLMTTSKQIHTKSYEYAAESPKKLPEQSSATSSVEETIPVKAQTPSASGGITHQRYKTTAENAVEPKRLEDGFIEITDPDEAERIVKEIGWLLASNTRKTNEAIQHLEKTIDEYKEITKSILQ